MNIHIIPDDEVESRLKYLTGKERELLHLLLIHIKEVESRKLHLRRGHPTMYEYLTKEFKYSGAAAMRRLQAARLIGEIPTAAKSIQTGDLNLSQLCELSRAVKEKEKSGVTVSTDVKVKILSTIAGKTTLEAQQEIAQELDLTIKKPEQIRMQKDQSVHLSVTFSKTQHDVIIKAKDKAAHILERASYDHSMSSFFEILAKTFLYDRVKPHLVQRAVDNTTPVHFSTLRSLVLARDQKCQYVDPISGKKCESTYGLEVDHRVPRWANGPDTIENLQVLCGAHNNLKYNQEAGIKNSRVPNPISASVLQPVTTEEGPL